MGDGAENVIGIIVWPIFMWEILNGDYLQLGLLSSLVITVTVLMQLGLGKMVDLKDKNKILKFGTFFYSIGWIIKMFVATAFHIFVVSAYHNITKMFTRTPFDAMTYEKAADQGHFVDEYTVIHEMAVNLGRFLMLIVVFVLISWVSLEWTFILGALAALTLNFLTPDSVIEEGRTAG
jgi:small-conductance mechanosensitive channel